MELGYKYTPGTDLTHMSLQHPHSHPGDISPVPEHPVVMDMANGWQTAYVGSLDYGVQGILVGKAKWKFLKLFHPHPHIRWKI